MTTEQEQQAFGALLDAALTGRLTRRQIFVRAATLGLSVSTMQVLLSACGASATLTSVAAGGDAPTAAATTAPAAEEPTATQAAGALRAAGGTPKGGGILKVGL